MTTALLAFRALGHFAGAVLQFSPAYIQTGCLLFSHHHDSTLRDARETSLCYVVVRVSTFCAKNIADLLHEGRKQRNHDKSRPPGPK